MMAASDYPGLRQRRSTVGVNNVANDNNNGIDDTAGDNNIDNTEDNNRSDNDSEPSDATNPNANNNNDRTSLPRRGFHPPPRRNMGFFQDNTHAHNQTNVNANNNNINTNRNRVQLDPQQTQHQQAAVNNSNRSSRSTHKYVIISSLVALLAVITPPADFGLIYSTSSSDEGVTSPSSGTSAPRSNSGSGVPITTSSGLRHPGLTLSGDDISDGARLKHFHKKDDGDNSLGLKYTGLSSSSTLISSDIDGNKRQQGGENEVRWSVEQVARAAVAATASDEANIVLEKGNNRKNMEKKERENDSNNNINGGLPPPLKWFFSHQNSHKTRIQNKAHKRTQDLSQEMDEKRQHQSNKKEDIVPHQKNFPILSFLRRFIDPSLLQSSNSQQHQQDQSQQQHSESNVGTDSSSSQNNSGHHYTNINVATEIIDKVLTSTPRLLAIANLLLAVTYLLHSAVADIFLGDAQNNNISLSNNANNNNAAMFGLAGPGGDDTNNNAAQARMMGGGVGATTSNRIHRSGRERLGGYLLFKLLLISAVVEPDTLDLLILLSWYTLLSFLRSLAHLAGMTTAHASASGQSPRRGVLKLLLVVLLCDFMAAAVCAALFHGAGWGMVILLTCDCALLAVDVLTHVARYVQQVLEEEHARRVGEIEERQLDLHAEIRVIRDDRSLSEEQSAEDEDDNDDDALGREEAVDVSREENAEREEELRNESSQLDHELELMERKHSRHLAVLDYVAFVLELFALVMTIMHFLHIWSLHGVTFNLVDGVLALHLHTAISALGKKITERRNLNRISRDLDGFFENATELEMRKASAVGDVCCICLGTMSTGNVKKVGCGHLFHTNCLKEVVERARSIEAARCPLCRASVVDGKQVAATPSTNNGMPIPPPGLFFGGFGNAANDNNFDGAGMNVGGGNNNERNLVGGGVEEQTRQQDDPNANNNHNNVNAGGVVNANADGTGTGAQQQQVNQGERALFRFSTEGILPSWLPVPALSFEVVRRPTAGGDTEFADDNVGAQVQERDLGNNDVPDNNDQQQQQDPPEQSLWRRFLILTGAIPMSPEEEAMAIAQLVDMFPQYDRADLLRELRDRGSADLVVESVLTGVFSGVARTGAVVRDGGFGQPTMPDINNDGENENNNDVNQVRNDNDATETQINTEEELIEGEQRSEHIIMEEFSENRSGIEGETL